MRKRTIFTLTVLLIVMFAGIGAAFGAEVSAEATLSPQTFALDEGARLSIAVSGVRKNAEIELPDMENIKLHPRGQSSQTSFINGKMSASITYNYIVQALAAGTYTLPPIKVRAGGEELLTKSLSFQVTGAGAESTSSQNGAKTLKDIAYMTVSEIGDHFPGEIVPVTIKVYFNRNYRVDLNSLPTLSGDGVVMPQLNSEPEQKQEMVDGVPFHVLTWKTSLTGIKTGKHSIKFSLDASLLIAQQRRSRFPSSQFGGSMFDNFFGNVQRKPITATSSEIVFNVVPLPENGRPDNFTGAIGDFSMKVSGSPLKVEVGEPITLTMTISGEGNFNRVESPIFPESASWKTYSPTSDFSADTNKYAGAKSFEQAIVVKEPGVAAIPSLFFSYFDPKGRKFITLQSEPIPLQVQGSSVSQPTAGTVARQVVASTNGGSQATSVSANVPLKEQSDQVPPVANLAPIHLEMGTLHGRIAPLFQKVWFIVLCGVCLIIIILLLFVLWRQQKAEREPGLTFHKKKMSQLQKDLEEVEQARSSGDAPLFLSRCRTAIQNHVGASGQQTASAMSLTDLKTQVGEGSVLLTIFARAEAAAYGGATLSPEEMTNYLAELKSALEKL